MISITYNIGCRNCLQGDGITHRYSLTDGDEYTYKKKKEYEVMTLIEKWRKEDEHNCSFCGSANVEVLDVAVNDHPLYNENYLKQDYDDYGYYILMLNIDKAGSEIKLKPGGHNKFDTDFLKKAVTQIVTTIKNRQDEFFKIQTSGNFFICVNGGMNWEYERIDVHIQRFRHAGLSKSEILNAIQPFANQIGISI